MKDNELKERIYSLFDNQVPDEFNKILSKSKAEERNNYMKEKTKNKGWFWKLAFTCMFLLVIGGGLFTYQRNFKVDSTIALDVNPSIELKINKKDKIISCNALNEDAEEILQDMDFKNVDIDIALNAIIGSMVTKGYINELSNSILISVDNNDPAKAEELRQKLVTKIDSILSSDKITGSVLSQTISKETAEAEEFAKKNNISVGKAKLILEVVKNNPLLKAENLVNLSINEINVLTQNKENSLSTVEKQGTASTKAYIGEEKAKEIAFNHAGVKNPLNVEVEFDTENGVILYEIEFEDTTYEYDYEIDAIDGSIIIDHKEKNDDIVNNNNTNNNNSNNNSNTNTNTNNKTISSTKAQEIALNNSGAKSATNVKNLKVEYDREDNEYSVEFYYNGYEYDYEINATTGNIISFDREKEYTPNDSTTNNKYITSNEAKNIALNHANVKNPQNLEVELDKEDNEYSVEFKYNGYEYEYEINATTGKIKSSSKERDD